MMEKFVVRPGSKSPSPDPIPEVPDSPEVPKSPVVKRKRKRKKKRRKRGDLAPDKGFAAEGSYWAPSARPGDVSSEPGDLEIIPKRKPPVASLPGVSQKQQRKDKKYFRLLLSFRDQKNSSLPNNNMIFSRFWKTNGSAVL